MDRPPPRLRTALARPLIIADRPSGRNVDGAAWERCADPAANAGLAVPGGRTVLHGHPSVEIIVDHPPSQPFDWWLFAGLRLLLGALGGVAAAGPREAGDPGTDRDAFTPLTHCVAPGTVLTEGSYVFFDNLTGLPTNNYPELLVRIGATERFEWRFGVNYGVG